jgi:hypothetical protein
VAALIAIGPECHSPRTEKSRSVAADTSWIKAGLAGADESRHGYVWNHLERSRRRLVSIRILHLNCVRAQGHVALQRNGQIRSGERSNKRLLTIDERRDLPAEVRADNLD